MGTGFLTVSATTGGEALPVTAHVTISRPDGGVLYEADTDHNGNTGNFPLSAPDKALTLDPYYPEPAYAVCDVDISAGGFVTKHVHGVQIEDMGLSILPADMHPLDSASGAVTDEYVETEPKACILPGERMQPGPHDAVTIKAWLPSDPPAARPIRPVYIPDYITVHLGRPDNPNASNVRVRFADYVANVASHEIYSTWPNASLYANIHCIVTFALNRVYTEWYRSRGFNFDITNSTSFDMMYQHGGQVFANLKEIALNVFNVYARRIGFNNPYFTEFCNGTTATCPGLKQWGTVSLAQQGMTPLEILRYYYPNDLELVSSNNIQGVVETYPGSPLGPGSQGTSVRKMQNYLNRIRVNFPLIPLISNPNGVYGADTGDAVRTFQKTFKLTADGVIGRATWNQITFIYVGVTKLAELNGEGERIGIGLKPPASVLSEGSRGHDVLELQFILDYIGAFYDAIPVVIKDGVFGASTKNAVVAFQKAFGLPQDGVVGPSTWDKLYSVFKGIQKSAPMPPTAPPPTSVPPYPGTPLRVGSSGPDVRIIQTYLNTIRIVYPSIPQLVVDSSFGDATRRAVVAFQQQFLLTPDGIVGPVTWNKIVEIFNIVTGNTSGPATPPPFPGTLLREGSRGDSVRLMQQYLNDLRARFPSLPALTVDGDGVII